MFHESEYARYCSTWYQKTRKLYDSVYMLKDRAQRLESAALKSWRYSRRRQWATEAAALRDIIRTLEAGVTEVATYIQEAEAAKEAPRAP